MRKLVIIIILLLAILAGWFAYQKLAFLNILVKFDELEPFERRMNVYYKGFKIGKTTKIFPDKDYKNTYLRLKIHPHDIKLPENITAKILKKSSGGYVDIVYPDSPSLTRIKNNVIIKGTITKDISSILNEKLGEEGIEQIITNASGLVENANNAVGTLNGIFSDIREILKDIRPQINASAKNLTITTKNIKEMSSNLNSSMDKETMEKTVKSIEEATNNVNEITYQINKVSIPMINNVICETNSTMKNVKEITGGVKNTLKKHFGLGRLIFGKPINDECNN